ncbi:hypothetical protein BKA65DRAFT_480765 [Rhexocercosporidium sp. MPI-PUGE-AT-0058]|nr:hypothetical protein BKA65DRAFT_480765 [Rhexocercosporidium sp. MPI-PUGE-AT-0058]
MCFTQLIPHSRSPLYPAYLVFFCLGNPQSAEYSDNWLVQPGPAGNGSGIHPNGGCFTTGGGIDNTYVVNGRPPMDQAILAIQTPPPGSWDFGVVKWKNIMVEAETITTEWCTRLPDGNGQFNWTSSDPVAAVDPERNTTTCYFASFTFLGERGDL